MTDPTSISARRAPLPSAFGSHSHAHAHSDSRSDPDWAGCGGAEHAARARPLGPDRPLVLVAAACLVDADGRVLVAQRPQGKAMAGLWEFPGGKVAANETPEQALVRELAEELGIDTRQSCLAPLAFASHAYQDFHLLMPLFACRRWRGTPKGHEGQALAWVWPRALWDLDMPEADRPLIPFVMEWI